jgi:signal transduction histidine kinase
MSVPELDRDPDQSLARRLAANRYPGQWVAMDGVAVVLVTVGFGILMPHQATRVPGAPWDLIDWLVCVVAPVATLFRRRVPRLTLAFALLVAVVACGLQRGGPAVFFVAMALYTVVVSSRRTALAGVGLTTGAVVAATIVGSGKQVVPASIGGAALLLLSWLAAENTRAGRAYARQRSEREAEKAASAAAQRAEVLSRALAQERAQIARELHDIVAHAMSVIAVRAGVARMVIDTQPEQAREALAIIETTTRRSLQEMRLLVGVLRDGEDRHPELVPAPGVGDLDGLVANIANAGVQVSVDIEGTVRALPAAADLSAYRIVQEALTNVARHAGPTCAQVTIAYRPDEVRIDVVDDGPGPRPSFPIARAGSGHGLIGMRERAALFGGELSAGPCAAGFRVTANLRTDGLPSDDHSVGLHSSGLWTGQEAR